MDQILHEIHELLNNIKPFCQQWKLWFKVIGSDEIIQINIYQNNSKDTYSIQYTNALLDTWVDPKLVNKIMDSDESIDKKIKGLQNYKKIFEFFYNLIFFNANVKKDITDTNTIRTFKTIKDIDNNVRTMMAISMYLHTIPNYLFIALNDLTDEDVKEVESNLEFVEKHYYSDRLSIEPNNEYKRQTYKKLKNIDKEFRYGFQTFQLTDINNDKYKCYKGYLDGKSDKKESHPIVPLVVFLERLCGLYDTISLNLRKNDKDYWFYQYAYHHEKKHNLDQLKKYINWNCKGLNQKFDTNNSDEAIIEIVETNQDNDVDESQYFVVKEVKLLKEISNTEIFQLCQSLAKNVILGINHINWLELNDIDIPQYILDTYTDKPSCEAPYTDLSINKNGKQNIYGTINNVKQYIYCDNYRSLSYKTCIKDEYHQPNHKFGNETHDDLYSFLVHPLVEWSPYSNVFMTYLAIIQDMNFPVRFINKNLGIGTNYYDPLIPTKLYYSGNKYISTNVMEDILMNDLIGIYIYITSDDREQRIGFNTHKRVSKVIEYKPEEVFGENISRLRVLTYPIFKLNESKRNVEQHFNSLYYSNRLSNYVTFHLYGYDIPKSLLFQSNRLTYQEFNFLTNYMGAQIYGTDFGDNNTPETILLSLKSLSQDTKEKLIKYDFISCKYDKDENKLSFYNINMQSGGNFNSTESNMKLSFSNNYEINNNIASHFANSFYKMYFEIIKLVNEEKDKSFNVINRLHPYKYLGFFTPYQNIKYFKKGTTIQQILNKSNNYTILKYKPIDRVSFLITNELLSHFNICQYLKQTFRNGQAKCKVVGNNIYGIEALNYQLKSNNKKHKLEVDICLKYQINQYKSQEFNDSQILNSINHMRQFIDFKVNYINNIDYKLVNNKEKQHFIYLTIKQLITKNGDIVNEIVHHHINLKQIIYGLHNLNKRGCMIINLTSMLTKFNADMFLLMQKYFQQVKLYVPEILPKTYISHMYMVMIDFKGINDEDTEQFDKILNDINKTKLGEPTDLDLYNDIKVISNYYDTDELDDMKKLNSNGQYLGGLLDIDSKSYESINIFSQTYHYYKLQHLNKINDYIKLTKEERDEYEDNNNKMFLIESINYAKKYNLDIIEIGSPNQLFNIKYGKLILEDLYQTNTPIHMKLRKPKTELKPENIDSLVDTLNNYDFSLSLNNLVLNLTGKNELDVAQDLSQHYKNDMDLYLNSKFTRVINKSYPAIDYIERKQLPRTTVHLGQRKLLYTEVEFFTLFLKPKSKSIVIYAGAAPGSHIPYLKDMFPNITFILYDPRPYDPRLKHLKDTYTYQEYFTNDVAQQLKKTFKDEDIYFISDIRTVVTEEDINSDLNMQKDWVEILKPRYSMLKFRLPRNTEDYKYMSGDVYLQIWSPISSTETRLMVPEEYTMIDYNVNLYEGQLQYFNRIARVQYYPHSYDIPGFDHCYDCYSELKILEKYYQKYNFLYPNYSKDTIESMVTNSVYQISKLLGYKHPHTFKTYDKFIINNQIFKQKSQKKRPHSNRKSQRNYKRM
jgi:hypothetical protein